MGSSFALVSDAVNSLGDSLTSVIVLVALWYAQRPADEEHPYGHTRAEAVAASNVAVIIIISALVVGWHAISRITVKHDLPPTWTLWIVCANFFIKEGLYRYKLGVGKRIGSTAIIANAWDHRSDAFCSLAVFIGLVVVRWGGPAYIWADEVAALFVVTAILWAGIKLFRTSTSELLDSQADEGLVQQIRRTASDISEVQQVEKLLVRKTGLEYLVDIHIQVDAQLSVDEGHRIGHQVKDQLVEKLVGVRDVLVHLEPFPHTHQQQ